MRHPQFWLQVHITEFGSDLSRHDYDHDDPNPSDGGAVNSLRGLDAALETLRTGGEPVAGLQYWHGWDNGDSYSFWGKVCLGLDLGFWSPFSNFAQLFPAKEPKSTAPHI